jgi:DNA repair protein RecN (Recombination protein N)
MLLALSVRDLVLVDRLDLAFDRGLSVLTGETGAGKSILLDALGLALGERGDTGLIRAGCDQAVVSAEFSIAGHAGLAAVMEEQGFPLNETIVFRRVIAREGPSRAFVDDQPVSVTLLRRLGDLLAEIQDQHETHGLLAVANHRILLDQFGALKKERDAVTEAFDARAEARRILLEAEKAAAKARADEDYVRHALDEFESLSPVAEEEEELAESRDWLRHGEQVAEALDDSITALQSHGGVESKMRLSERHLARAAKHGGDKIDSALDQLARAQAESAEALNVIKSLRYSLDEDTNRLEMIEERLFALRALARKHNCSVDNLTEVWARTRETVSAIDNSSHQLETLRDARDAADRAYGEAANALSASRLKVGARLDKAVIKELKPLRLAKAKFRTSIVPGPIEDGGRDGLDTIRFDAITNPGQEFGALHRIASGGELTRFMLALKVVLASAGEIRTLVFDEADSGVGGATADAVGERLAKLAASAQILAVTHSPQVAARATSHYTVTKIQAGGKKTSGVTVEQLSEDGRREEIARMLAGAEVTEEARAAADRLMELSPEAMSAGS